MSPVKIRITAPQKGEFLRRKEYRIRLKANYNKK